MESENMESQSDASITWRVHDFARIRSPARVSEPFTLPGVALPCHLHLFPFGDGCRYLSLYLVIEPGPDARRGWAFTARFTLTVHNQNDEVRSEWRELVHTFTSSSPSWGARELVPLRILDAHNGFVSEDGSLLVSCDVHEVEAEGELTRAASAGLEQAATPRNGLSCPLRLAERAGVIASARASGEALPSDRAAVEELFAKLRSRPSTPALDAFESALSENDDARCHLDAAQARVRLSPTDASAIAARGGCRASHARSLAAVHRSYRGDEFRREASLLAREADDLKRLLGSVSHAANCAAGRPGAAAADTWRHAGDAPAAEQEGDARTAEQSREACGAALAAVAGWAGAADGSLLTTTTDEALRSAWSALATLGASCGAQPERERWAEAATRAHDAFDAELAWLAARRSPQELATLPMEPLTAAVLACVLRCERQLRLIGTARAQARGHLKLVLSSLIQCESSCVRLARCDFCLFYILFM
jgi:hypothetical protein